MNLTQPSLKKHFKNKELKDEIDFSNKISDIKVPEFISKPVGDYFWIKLKGKKDLQN